MGMMRCFGWVMMVCGALLAGVALAEGRVPDSAEDIDPIKVGQTIPEVTLMNSEGQAVKLADWVKRKPTILIFYRGSWCPYCNTQLGELKTIEGKLEQMGYQLIAISPDLPVNLKSSIAQHKFSYTILSDSTAEAAIAFGLGFRVDDALYAKYLNYDINLEKASGEKHHILPVPAALVINTAGKVHFTYVNSDYKKRVKIHDLLAAAEAALK
ncbi:MAG: AhpC/TSA family protein [Agarilytica sp.]